MTKENGRLARATFWILAVQLVLVILIFGFSVFDLYQRTGETGNLADRNAVLIGQNAELIQQLAEVSNEQTELIICLLLIEPDLRTKATVEQCLHP